MLFSLDLTAHLLSPYLRYALERAAWEARGPQATRSLRGRGSVIDLSFSYRGRVDRSAPPWIDFYWNWPVST